MHLQAARICLNKLKDHERAAHWLFKASQLADVPAYVNRMYAGQLVHLGRIGEALNVLQGVAKHLKQSGRHKELGLLLHWIDEIREQHTQ